ncbi:hypothetical protein [Microbulbifer sp. SSSA005]|uniref:hypothetical protein n=1 Tax=unclassified Microbulbifer TaxID=2619833 RepID=UPI0040398D11
MIHKVSVTLAVIHLVSVFIMGYLIVNSSDGSAVMAWLLYLTIDFPVGWGMVPLAYVVEALNFVDSIGSNGEYSIYRDIPNFWYPAIYIGVVGTVWWYYLPQLILRSIRWLRSGRSI